MRPSAAAPGGSGAMSDAHTPKFAGQGDMMYYMGKLEQQSTDCQGSRANFVGVNTSSLSGSCEVIYAAPR
jgi:hypothetical protein